MLKYSLLFCFSFLNIHLLLAQKSDSLNKKNLPKYQNLVMEGGGIKGICYGGALIELENRGILPQIKRVGGTSAGAIQACLLSVGYSAEEIAKIIADTPVETFNDGGSVFRASKRFLRKFGWYEGKNLQETIETLVRNRSYRAYLTFGQLHELSKNPPFRDLYITGVNLTKQRLEIFSHETYPNMRIADAVRISMSVPLYYKAISIDAEGKIIENPTSNDDVNVFVDGGVLLNYPIELFDETRYINNKANNLKNEPIFNEETLGLRLERCEQIDHETQLKAGVAPLFIGDFKSYVSALYTVMTENASRPKKEDVSRTIYINDFDMNPRVRKLSDQEKSLLITSGRQGVIDFFTNQ